MNANTTDLSAERLRELLAYDPDTGLFTWKVARNRVPAGAAAGSPIHGYVRIRIDGIHYRAHRLAWLYIHGEWPEGDVDHTNRVKSDNRIANLRVVSPAQNSQNRGLIRSNTSGTPGVCWRGHRGKWGAFIVKDRKHISLGLYEEKQDAIKARQRAMAQLFTHAPSEVSHA